MSEPYSLIAQVSLTENQYKAFRDSQVEPLNRYSDWLNLHSGVNDSIITQVSYTAGCTIGGWLDAKAALGSNVYLSYEKDRGIFTFAILMFSEDLVEYLEALNVLRSIDRFKDQLGSDFIGIYPWFWVESADFEVLIKIELKKSVVMNPKIGTEEIDGFRKFADKLLQEKMDAASSG